MRMVYKILLQHSIANSVIQMLQAISEIQVNYEFILFEIAFQENQKIQISKESNFSNKRKKASTTTKEKSNI